MIAFTKVLDSDTPIPGEEGTFGVIHGLQEGSLPGHRLRYPDPHIAMDADGNLAFGPGVFPGRLYAIIDGLLHVVTQLNGDTGQISIDESRVTFGVIDLGGRRIGGLRWEPAGDPIEIAGGHFLWGDGSPQQLGDLVQPVDRPWIDGGLIAFVGQDGAIHAQEFGQPPTRIVGSGDGIRSGVLGAVRDPQVAAGRVAFVGRKGADAGGRWGVYIWEGVFSLLVEEGMQLPEGRRLDVLPSGTVSPPLRLGVDRFALVGRDDQGTFLYLT